MGPRAICNLPIRPVAQGHGGQIPEAYCKMPQGIKFDFIHSSIFTSRSVARVLVFRAGIRDEPIEKKHIYRYDKYRCDLIV